MMQPITRNEILPIGDYEQIRPHFRARVIESKRARRASVGDDMSLTFENRDTVLLQIQEMLRTERITSEPAVMHEIETYNDLIPGPKQLSATLFVEIPDAERRERTLKELRGLERAVSLDVSGGRFRGQADAREVEGYERTTAVIYLKFTLDDAAIERVRGGEAPVSVVIDHPNRQLVAPLTAATVRSLADDLA